MKSESQEKIKATGKREVYAEDYLQEQLSYMYKYLNEKNKNAFDEHVEMVEGILFQRVDVKKELIDYKKKLFTALYLRLTEISYKASEIGSHLKKERYKQSNTSKLEWAFRRDYLQFIVNKFFDKDFIRFVRPEYAKLKGVKNGEEDIHEGSLEGKKPSG